MRIGAAVFVGAALFATSVQAQSIVSARYLEPTDVYGHGAVSQGEYARLNVTLNDGVVLNLSYANAVFEDTVPRLHDFDNDGSPEVVTVVSTFDAGARVQIFTLRDGTLVPFASNPPIGTRNRWLAIAGIADFNGDGIDDIAYVDRPHLAKVLRILSVERDGSEVKIWELATKEGLSNHQYQSPKIEGGVRLCETQAPVILTANTNWTSVMETVWQGGGLVSKRIGPYVDDGSFAAHMECDAVQTSVTRKILPLD